MTKKSLFIAFVVSLGGFLFGFDAGIISGVMSYVGPEFNLNDAQTGWVVSSPSFSAMIAMLIAGKMSDQVGRKKILIIVAFLYAFSAVASAYSFDYQTLYISRMIGGLAFGAALILAPTYIAEISNSNNRGTLVSIQQLNIVLGFFAAFLSNYFFNEINSTSGFFNDENVWRWMLGVEFVPAILYFILMFFVPMSPRWLYNKGKFKTAKEVLIKIHGKDKAEEESKNIKLKLNELTKASENELFYTQVLKILLEGKEEKVVLKELQREPVKGKFLHADFQRVSRKTKLKVVVPFRFIGEEDCEGVKTEGGVIAKAISEIEIACLAGDIPEAIEIDITNLMLNDAIRLSDLTLPEGAEIPGFDEENDQMIVSVNPPRAEEEEPEIVAEGEEGETADGEETSEDQGASSDDSSEEAESSD